jgi:hypothetical protein
VQSPNETVVITYPEFIDESPETVVLEIIYGFDETYMSLNGSILTLTNIQADTEFFLQIQLKDQANQTRVYE